MGEALAGEGVITEDDSKQWDMKVFSVLYQINLKTKNSMLAFWLSNDDHIKSVRIPKHYVAEVSAVLENCFKRAEKQATKPGVKKIKQIK